MNQRQTKKYIGDQLYRVDGLFARSAKDAARLAGECKVSARGLILMAEARSSLPPESWSGFYRALEQVESGKRKQNNGIWEQLARHRRLAVAALLIVLALAFFTLVPAGRAIAESIFDYVIGVRDHQLEINQREEQQLYEERGYDIPDTMSPEAAESIQNGEELQIESDPVYYPDIATFEAAYQLDAFSFNSDQVRCVEVFETDNLFTGKTLRTSYRDADGNVINVIEQWYTGDGVTAGSNSDFYTREILNQRTMYYTIDSVDGSFNGFVLLDQSILTVYADKNVDLDLVWQLLS